MRKATFENIVEKGENDGNKHLLLSFNVFCPIEKCISYF